MISCAEDLHAFYDCDDFNDRKIAINAFNRPETRDGKRARRVRGSNRTSELPQAVLVVQLFAAHQRSQ